VTWHDEWAAIASRIEGLLAAGGFFVQTLRVNSEDPYGVATHLGRQAQDLASSIERFATAHTATLPPGALSSLNGFLSSMKPKIDASDVVGLNGLKVRITSLAWLRAEIDYHLSDFTAQARRRSERAFVHLQQSIVADEAVRTRWQGAYDEGETACERLGGAHLLAHGIWGFKVHGSGARTDLVFGEPLDVEGARVAEALVLTEWKVVRKKDDPVKVAAAARAQADLYSSGVLGGLELAEYRYVVLVSSDRLAVPDDVPGPSTYRHVNIAVAPSTPSKAAAGG
jgi:hypothetical protein